MGLANTATRWKRAMENGAIGPLVIAKEVCAVVDNWDVHRSEAEDQTASAWLRAIFGAGKYLAFWRKRSHAVEVLGEAFRRTLHHEAAVWVVGQGLSAQQLRVVKRGLLERYHAENKNPLTKQQALAVVRGVVPHVVKSRSCTVCDRLVTYMLQQGHTLPEWIEAPRDAAE